MRIFLNLFVSALALTGCAFKDEPKEQVAVSESGTLNFTVDWIMEGEQKADPMLKAKRILSESGNFYTTDAIVTLPSSVPSALILVSELPIGKINQEIDFLRAHIDVGGNHIQVPIELSSLDSIEQKQRLAVQVTGLGAAFKSNKSASGVLKIEAFSRTTRMVSIDASFRTPPSELKAEQDSLKSWIKSAGKETLGNFVKPVIGKNRLNLVQIIRFENEEMSPVEIQTQRRPKGSVTQYTNPVGYQGSTCSHTLTSNPQDVLLSEDLILLPLDSRFLIEAQSLIKNKGLQSFLRTEVLPGTEALFGFFAIGEKSNDWMEKGPLPNESYSVQAPVSCKKICKITQCEQSPGKDHFIPIAGNCNCVSWDYKTEYASISVGIERGAVFLNLPNEALSISSRFSDLDSHRDGEVRVKTVLQSRTELEWSEDL